MSQILRVVGGGAKKKLSFFHRKFQTARTVRAVNQFGVELLPDSYNQKLFRGLKPRPVNATVLGESLSELEKFGLTSGGTEFNLPDIAPYLSNLQGGNVLQHFQTIGLEQTRPYLELLEPLLEAEVPDPPAEWRLEPGWTRYGFDGAVAPIDFPQEGAIVFDVETSVRTDPRAVMAVAVSHLAWYSWLSPYFLSNEGFPADVRMDSLIPLGSDSSPRLVIGHNVSYDRIRVGSEYNIERSGTRFLDTMSLHIAYSGMTSSQRMVKAGEKKLSEEIKPKWLQNTSMNGLADCHAFYCKPESRLEKDVRNAFVKLTLAELRDDCHNLVAYCAGDVAATLQLSRALIPKFLKSCSHPATLSGMLTMSSSYLPTNNCWQRYLEDSEAAYENLERGMMDQLETEVRASVGLLKDEAYRRDPWLWDLDWVPASAKTKRRRILDKIDDLERYETLGKYPTWFQELAHQEPGGKPFLKITTSKRIVPKILRLTWKGFPLHYDKTDKWGYLVPTPNVKQVLEDIESGEIIADFPLKEFLDSLDNRSSVRTTDPTEIFVDQVRDFSDRNAFGTPVQKDEEAGKGIDVGLPGVLFHKLPHKNGPKFRVGNPLGKDFLAAVGEGGALASAIANLAGELLKVSSQLAYWRNARDRLSEQIKVDLTPQELPDVVTQDPEYSEDNTYSAILPSLVVCGTVTRRAVEKTWLTASNARLDRVGSELKTAIRAPPGFHFVGADVDSQELWLASVLGDAVRGGHGSTPLGWMSLQGERSKGTDLHSKTAAAAQVSRDQAKILNYARIYGAGEMFAKLLLKQYNPDLSDTEVAARARHMYEQTKGLRGYKLNKQGAWLYEFMFEEADNGQMIPKKIMNILAKKMGFMNQIVKESKYINHKDRMIHCHLLTDEVKTLYGQFLGSKLDLDGDILLDDKKLKDFVLHLEDKFGGKSNSDFDVLNSLVGQTIWFGGSESHTFNRLEEIAMSEFPKTPVLGANISRALDSRLIGRGYLPSRINWVVQSTAVDYLHLLLVSMEWFMQQFNIKGRFTISIHDEVRYMVESEDRYKAALALHLSNLLVRAHVVASLGLDTLPSSTAFFSSVDIDTVLRKEPNSDCRTPSNPEGLLLGHGVPFGEGLDIHQVLDKLNLKLGEKPSPAE